MPDAIAADHASLRIYYTDQNFIGSTTYDGRDPRRIAHNARAYFFDIAVFEV